MTRRLSLLLFALGFLVPSAARAGDKLPADFRPDPRCVQRYGPAYRYWQNGWIVLHIEGKPYERGVQHGRLLAPEIAAHVRCFAATQNPKSPAEGWKQTRTLANALFLRRYDAEFLEEMKGIADGAAAAGAKFDGRAIDLIDVVALNAWPEIDTLDGALDATPTGLEGMRFPQAAPKTPPKPMRCSAFAATGKATKDGKIVFGHITMFSLYPSSFYNVWLDIKPSEGHRVLMQSYPAGMQSGMDYYMNDAGLLISETTLAQTRFEIKGAALASRIRKAIQYADGIDKAVEILRADNNGLYTNEWLLADIKTDEIAMFELGTHKDRLYRSGKDDWFGGTEGFYWGCNNTKDLNVRLETVASVKDRPSAVVFRPSDRDKTWLKLYDQHKGKIDAEFGKLAFTTPPLAAIHSCDAKFTTTEMAKELKTWALFGPPLGRTWQPTQEEREKYPAVQPMVGNPWTVLHPGAPPKTSAEGDAVDLHDTDGGATRVRSQADDPPTEAAWHGTLLPKADADVWLAVGFARYERIVALEKALQKRSGGKLTAADQERLAVALFAPRSSYFFGARGQEEKPLSQTKADLRTDAWYEVASGKGVLLLHQLRQLLGADAFDALMEEYGRGHAGQEVSTADFRAFLEKKTDRRLEAFFDPWLNTTGLPHPLAGNAAFAALLTNARGEKVEVALWNPKAKELEKLTGTIRDVQRHEQTVGKDKVEIEVLVLRTSDGVRNVNLAHVQRLRFLNPTLETVFQNEIKKTERAPPAGTFSVLTFHAELEQTLIVYGTRDEANTNKEAAEALQRGIIERHSNYTVPIKSDRDVTDDDLKNHHVLLIGRPDCNRLTEKHRAALPVKFGTQSFVVGDETYAHQGSAVVAAAENPLHPRYSLVVLAGLNGGSTLRTAARFMQRYEQAEIVVYPNESTPRSVVTAPNGTKATVEK
jgi:hypothetical protein